MTEDIYDNGAIDRFVEAFLAAYEMYQSCSCDVNPKSATLYSVIDYLIQTDVFNIAVVGDENPTTGDQPWIATTDVLALDRKEATA